MRLRGTLLLVLVVLAPPASAGPRRHGRVVRVERPRRIEPERVRLCMLTSPDEGKMMCYGQEPPVVGSSLDMVDETGLRGTGVVRETAPSAFDACRLGSAHDVTVDVDGPRPATGQAYSSGYVVALQGVTLTKSARLVPNIQIPSPSRRDLEQVWIAVDRDGDATPDMLGTVADCTQEVHSLPVPAGGQHVTPYCIDYWLDEGSGWNRVGRDIFYQCM